MTVTRRGVLSGVTVLAAASLAGCQSSSGSSRLATEAHASVSPSGQFSALIAGAADGLHPMIRQADGEPVWVDEVGHDPHVYPVVAWESSADVLWVLSSATGGAAVRRDGNRWVKSEDTGELPSSLADLTRRAPEHPSV